MSAVVVIAWMATMALFAWRGRPRPSSPARAVPRVAGNGPTASGPRAGRPVRLLERAGSLVHERVPSLLVVPAQALGAALVVLALVAPVSPVFAIALAVATAGVSWWRSRAARARRRRRVERELPAFVDLLRLAVDAGLNTRLALIVVAPGVVGELAPALHRMLREVERGESLAVALHRLGQRVGPPLTELTTVLASAERTGASVGPLLGRVADDLRRSQRVGAEERARRLPVLLLVPLVFCVLPAFVIVAVVPMLVTGTASFSFPSP